jgi:hypothetical protein
MSDHSKAIAEAVSNDSWQRFRVSLKGKATGAKLTELAFYYEDATRKIREKYIAGELTESEEEVQLAHAYARVDNYLKSLARGGFLHPGVDLKSALEAQWRIDIRKQ